MTRPRSVLLIDVEGLLDAMDVEARARELLVVKGREIKSAYRSEGRLPEIEGEEPRRAVRTWLKAVRLVANVTGEPVAGKSSGPH